MSVSIIMAFRECLEMLLIILPLLIFLNNIGKKSLSKYVYYGSAVGIVINILAGVFLIGQVNKLDGYFHQLFLGGSMIFLAILILYSIVMLSKQSKELTLNVTEKYDVKLNGLSLFLLAFVTVFREGIEIVLFLLPLSSENPLKLALGVLLGTILSLIPAYILFKTSAKINVYIIFSILTLILIFIGGHFLGEGLGIIYPEAENFASKFGELIYIVPLLFLFLKRELRKYLKK